MRRLMLALVALVTVGLAPQLAEARVDEKGRPFARGTFQPSLGLGANFGGRLSVIDIGLGARYFIVNGLGPGLYVSDTILLYSEELRADYPGIASQTPTNIVRVMPNLQWVFVRTRWFSPYVTGGAGPVFYNHGGGTVGEWTAGGGAFIGLGGPIFVDLGVNFSSVFPRSKCEDAFYYKGPMSEGQVLDACSFTWGPRLGLTVAFGVGGGGGKKRSRREKKSDPPPAPPERAWEAPAEEASPAPEPLPAAPEPVEPPASEEPEAGSDLESTPEGPEAPPAEPPAEGAPSDLAAPPADTDMPAPPPAPLPDPPEGD